MNDDDIYTARLELVDFPIEVFWDAPREEFIEDLLAGDVLIPDGDVNDDLTAGFRYLREFIDDHAGDDPAEVADDLAGEYTRLFAAPRPPVLPHETYYREDTDLLGSGLAEVEASYAAAGWSRPEEYPEESDFIAVELAFLRWVIERQQRGQEEAFGYERVFLDNHLLGWKDAFLADLAEHTDEKLFLAAGHVFAGLVEFEDELVAQMVPN